MSIKRKSDSLNVELTEAELDTVTGGLKWEGHRQSTNVEDRRVQSMGDFARWDKTESIGGYGGGWSGGGRCWFMLC